MSNAQIIAFLQANHFGWYANVSVLAWQGSGGEGGKMSQCLLGNQKDLEVMGAYSFHLIVSICIVRKLGALVNPVSCIKHRPHTYTVYFVYIHRT